jgi:anti-sigma factor ChrR (cupin superfamily)
MSALETAHSMVAEVEAMVEKHKLMLVDLEDEARTEAAKVAADLEAAAARVPGLDEVVAMLDRIRHAVDKEVPADAPASAVLYHDEPAAV